MGQCFSAMKGGGSRKKAGKMARPNNANHMGPEGVENSIFLGKDESLFPKRDPASAGSPPPHAAGDDVNAELAPLNELVPNQNGAATNGGPQPPPKQAVMRRSFPPVGVSLYLEDPMTQAFADPQRMAEVQNEITQTIAGIFMTQAERFRIMQVRPSDPPATVTMQMNIVADRSDNDMRSPMQLAAELVTQSKNGGSQLRAAPVLSGLRDGFIAEDPFPGTKQDSWAGGVATLRPTEGGGEGKKKKKSKAASSGGPGAALAAQNQEARGKPGAQGNGQEGASSAEKPAPAVPTSLMDHATTPPAMPPEEGQSNQPGDRRQVASREPTDEEKAASNTADLPGGSIVKDGGKYAGELMNGQRHGRGKQQYPNGDVFTGCFQKDKRVGIGRLDLADNGGFYLGEWKEDERSGKGSLTYGNKDMYVGTWAKGMREGDGKLLWSTGAWYQGQFKKDLMHGVGTLQNENQDKYEGDFFEGKKHGKGRWTPAGGATRAGYWCMDEEMVGKSDEEAQQMIREALSKANKALPSTSHSDELAAKLLHRTARNEALANEEKQQQHASAAEAQMKISASAPAQPAPPQDKPPPTDKAVADLQVGTPSASAGVSPSQPAQEAAQNDDGKAQQDSAQRRPMGQSADPEALKPAGPEARRGVPPSGGASQAAVASSNDKRAAAGGAKQEQESSGAAGAGSSKPASKTASISQAKPPTRPQRTGASMSTNDTLKAVSDKLAVWQASGGSLSYDD